VEPGWYPDPGAFRARWWDGTRWTNRVVGAGPRLRYSPPEAGWPPPSPEDVRAARGKDARWSWVPTWWVLLLGVVIVILLLVTLYGWSQSAP
jgi:hypothetical protein